MKKYFLILLLIPNCLVAQFRGSNWCFPDSAMIHFDGTNAPTIFSSVIHNTTDWNPNFTTIGTGVFLEAAATISSENGNLLCYSNGETIWNKNHEVMLNGNSLQCDYSTTNGVLILPYPENDSLYEIIYTNDIDGGLSFSKVNMNLDGGLGAVIPTEKNIPLISDTLICEKLCAVRHGNGRDWWIVVHNSVNTFYKFLLTPSGIFSVQSQSIGIPQQNNSLFGISEMLFSKDGSTLGFVNLRFAETFSFNRCTGQFSNEIILDSVSMQGTWLDYYSGAFSEDGSKFYVSNEKDIFQFDLENAIPSSTKTLIWHNHYGDISPLSDSAYSLRQMELGDNNKIYVTSTYRVGPETQMHFGFQNMNLCVINEPDSLGTACNFVKYSQFLGGRRTHFGLPNMPNYNLSALDESECDSLNLSIEKNFVETKSIVRIFPNPAADELTIEILNGIAPQQIEIVNALGQKVLQLHQTKPTALINIHTLPSGTYFIKVHLQNGELLIKKFIKQ